GEQSAQKSEELRGDLIDRWTALGRKHGYKAEQMVPDAAQRDKLLGVIEQVYVTATPPSGKARDKLRVEVSRRNDTEKDGNCFFHAVCGSLRDLLAKGAVDRALIDIGKEEGHVACRAETAR